MRKTSYVEDGNNYKQGGMTKIWKQFYQRKGDYVGNFEDSGSILYGTGMVGSTDLQNPAWTLIWTQMFTSMLGD
jgi:hypothetical protein